MSCHATWVNYPPALLPSLEVLVTSPDHGKPGTPYGVRRNGVSLVEGFGWTDRLNAETDARTISTSFPADFPQPTNDHRPTTNPFGLPPNGSQLAEVRGEKGHKKSKRSELHLGRQILEVWSLETLVSEMERRRMMDDGSDSLRTCPGRGCWLGAQPSTIGILLFPVKTRSLTTLFITPAICRWWCLRSKRPEARRETNKQVKVSFFPSLFPSLLPRTLNLVPGLLGRIRPSLPFLRFCLSLYTQLFPASSLARPAAGKRTGRDHARNDKVPFPPLGTWRCLLSYHITAAEYRFYPGLACCGGQMSGELKSWSMEHGAQDKCTQSERVQKVISNPFILYHLSSEFRSLLSPSFSSTKYTARLPPT